MSSDDFRTVLPTLMRELVEGAPDERTPTYMLNRGDVGLLAVLDRLSAASASAQPTGGASIAAHVDHLRYGLSLLNTWAAGVAAPSQDADWTASWKRNTVSESEWRTLRDELRREATSWMRAMDAPRQVSETEAAWIASSVAHVAYHFGAIRQIDCATRGPRAEDEAAIAARSRE
jgi:hypothetical protein